MRFLLIGLFLFLGSCHKKELDFNEIQTLLPKVNIYAQTYGDLKRGSIIGIEPYLTEIHYVSEETAFSAFRTYFDFVRENGMISIDRSIVILPAHIGTWLVLCSEDKSVFKEKSFESAIQQLIAKNIGSFLWNYIYNENYAKDKIMETMFRMKAWQMSYRYQSVFSRLAKEYGVSIVAGSIILPEPKVVEGKITPTDGPLQNVSFFFHSDGRVDEKITYQEYVTNFEREFVSKGEIIKNQKIKTAFGDVFTAVGIDSWFPKTHKILQEKEIFLLLNPSFATRTEQESKIGTFNETYSNELNISKSDFGKLSYSRIWKKYGLPSRLKPKSPKAAVTVFFRGRIWDLNLGGEAYLYLNGSTVPNLAKTSENQGRIFALFL